MSLPRSSRATWIGLGAFVIFTTACVYGLLHGSFDHGKFEVKQSQWFSANQVAVVAERSDADSLGGLEYYVLVGNHSFTPDELRHAYYSDAVVFNTSRDCLTLHWEGQNHLTISCSGSTVDGDQINAQRQQIGNIAVSYEHIALK